MSELSLLPLEISYFSHDLKKISLHQGDGFIPSPFKCEGMKIGICFDLPDNPDQSVFVTECIARKVLSTGKQVESVQTYIDPITGSKRVFKRLGIPAPLGGCFELRYEINTEVLSNKFNFDTNMQDNFRLIAAGINHELRSPLQAISMYSDIIEDGMGDVKELASFVKEEIKSITDILDTLGRFNNNQKSNLEYESLDKVIKTTWDTVALTMLPSCRSIDVKFKVQRGFSKLIPNIPKSELQQVLTNIFRNSIESLDKDKSCIEVKLAHKTDKFFSFYIRDNGCGIPKNKIKNIFTPFVSSKSGSHGLGLTICRYFITQRGGTIMVLSEEGKSTDVIISLPIRGGDE